MTPDDSRRIPHDPHPSPLPQERERGFYPAIPVSNVRVACATSLPRISASPTRKRLDARLGQTSAIRVNVQMPLSADHDPAGGNQRHQPLAHLERGLEAAQVAVVDADEAALERQRAIEFVFVMDLDQHVETEVVRRLVQRPREVRRRPRP